MQISRKLSVRLLTKYFSVADNSVVKIMRLVGETMPKVFKGETTMLEHFRTSGLLDEYYAHGFGTMQSSMWLSGIVKQLTDRRPHLNLLEIGKPPSFQLDDVTELTTRL